MTSHSKAQQLGNWENFQRRLSYRVVTLYTLEMQKGDPASLPGRPVDAPYNTMLLLG